MALSQTNVQINPKTIEVIIKPITLTTLSSLFRRIGSVDDLFNVDPNESEPKAKEVNRWQCHIEKFENIENELFRSNKSGHRQYLQYYKHEICNRFMI